MKPEVVNGVARFKVQNSWVCFDAVGNVWVEEYGTPRNERFGTVQSAMSWIYEYGDRG